MVVGMEEAWGVLGVVVIAWQFHYDVVLAEELFRRDVLLLLVLLE